MGLAWKTPQFWLLWGVLCLNVTAGIGILGQASLLCQDMFGVSAAVGGGFAGLLSLFNMAGRLFWSSVSDVTGRKAIYCVFFLFGAFLYSLVPMAQKYHSVTLFVLITALIISMYGGGFATIPAYLRDLFGTMHLGAIHGRLITAWSMAAVLGPQLVNYISTYRIEHGIGRAEAYNVTMYLMAGLLLVGLACNLFVVPVEKRFHHRDADLPRSPSGGGDLIPRPRPTWRTRPWITLREVAAVFAHHSMAYCAHSTGMGSRSEERGQVAAPIPDVHGGSEMTPRAPQSTETGG